MLLNNRGFDMNNTKIVNKDKQPEIKTKDNRFIALILKMNKSCALFPVSFDKEYFRYDKHTYFPIPDGMYLGTKKTLIAVYLEGISTPFSHKNIEKEKVERILTLENGEEKTVELELIKGLKYDSEIIDILLNRGLAEKFTELKPEKTIFIVLILNIINIIVSFVIIGILAKGGLI